MIQLLRRYSWTMSKLGWVPCRTVGTSNGRARNLISLVSFFSPFGWTLTWIIWLWLKELEHKGWNKADDDATNEQRLMISAIVSKAETASCYTACPVLSSVPLWIQQRAVYVDTMMHQRESGPSQDQEDERDMTLVVQTATRVKERASPIRKAMRVLLAWFISLIIIMILRSKYDGWISSWCTHQESATGTYY